MLSDYVSFHSMYIEETLHKSDSLYFFIGGNSGIGTLNYTKHGGEARDLKLEIPGTLPTVRICISLIFNLKASN